MGIDPMNNISIIIRIHFVVTLSQHQARERIASSTTSGGQHHQYHLGTLTGVSINHRNFSHQ
jgi:hypothetical protein